MFMRRYILLLFAALLALLAPAPVFAASPSDIGGDDLARDITGSCFVSVPPDEAGYIPGTGALHDGDLKTYMRLPESGPDRWTGELRGEAAQGVYIQWEYAPERWTLEAADSRGSVLLSDERGGTGYIQEFVPLPEGTVNFSIIQPGGIERPLSMLELSVWSRGALPDTVHCWDPTPTQCELMVISAHQDDEMLFFGGVLPYYAGEKQLDTVVVYMADCGSRRLHEALNGLWVCGVRQYPVFIMKPDVKSLSISSARRTWDEQEITDIITRLFLIYKPQVVVTHDINGEYGHGQHMLTALCTQRALIECENADYAKSLLSEEELEAGYGPYAVPKCYLHLWEENETVMDWQSLWLDRLGMTAADAASRGYDEHVSQHRWYDGVYFGGEYDCARFGLYHTYAGKDMLGGDLFENITPRIQNPAEVPEPPAGSFTPYGHSGFVYTGSDSGGDTVYIRYGTVEDQTGWYMCDRTGALVYSGGEAVPYRGDILSVIGSVFSPDPPVQQDDPAGGDIYDNTLLGSRFFRIVRTVTGGEPAAVLAAFIVFFIAILMIIILIFKALIRGGRRRRKRA